MKCSRRQALASLGAALALPCLTSPALAARGLFPRTDAGPFLGAVRRGELERIRAWLAKDKALARARDDQGRSAYVLAHLHGHAEVAELLHSTGFELDLVESVLAEDWERFEALAKEKPEQLNGNHPIGGTPLHLIGLVGSHGGWRLRAEGCRPDTIPKGGNGFTAARTALESTNTNWARIGLTDLCSNGSDVNAPQRDGDSVLHGTVARRSEMLARLAIRKGADVDARDAQGRTPRELASELGWSAGEKLLAQHAKLPRDHRASRFALDANREPIVRPDLADVAQSRQSEVTSASHFDLAKVRKFVAEDERLVFSISTDDELAIEACAHIGTRDIMRFHLDHGAPLSLPTAVSLGDLDSVAAWLEEDPMLVHERGAHDFPLMWYAPIGGGSVEMAELLTYYDVPIDQESMGTTALHWCVQRGARDLAAFLIENGADVEAVGFRSDRNGETPLQAAKGKESPVTKLIRQAGAKR